MLQRCHKAHSQHCTACAGARLGAWPWCRWIELLAFQQHQLLVSPFGAGTGWGEGQSRLARRVELGSPTRVSLALYLLKHGHSVKETHCWWLQSPQRKGGLLRVAILLLLEPWALLGSRLVCPAAESGLKHFTWIKWGKRFGNYLVTLFS